MSIRVLSYNIQLGGETRRPLIEEVIRRERPHVVALLEASDRNNAEAVARRLDMELTYGEANNDEGHIAWLTRLPVLRSANHRHPELAKTLLELEVLADDRRVVLFATHLGSRWDRAQPPDEIPIVLRLMQPAAHRPHLLVGDFNALRPDDAFGDPPPGVAKRGDAIDGAPRRAIGCLLNASYIDCYRHLHPHPWGASRRAHDGAGC